MRRSGKRAGTGQLYVLCALALVAGANPMPLSNAAAQASVPAKFTDPAFQRIWERSDLPVASGKAARSWAWGNAIGGPVAERYREAPEDMRTVQYFDKARMEVNDPAGNRNDPYFVTNGRLVVEMASGEIQLGLNDHMYVGGAETCVAGDCPRSTYDTATPTFADLYNVSSLTTSDESTHCRTMRYMLCRSFEIPTGEPMPILYLTALSYVYDAGTDAHRIPEGLIPPGESPVEVKSAAYVKETEHNIPDVFWNFLNAEGTVYERGAYSKGRVVDWVSAFGFPITEPSWIPIRVGGQRKLVLFQAFERRTLTYSPHNPENWRVEMGNVGAQYLSWRERAWPVCSGRGVGHFLGLTDFWYAHGDVQRDIGCPSREVPFDRVDPNLHNIDLIVKTAYQPFEHGAMLYMDRTVWRNNDELHEQAVYVLFDDGRFLQFPDTWVEGNAGSSGSQPPDGMLEPQRGFGKVWREADGGIVRRRLGWATAAEQGAEGRLIRFRFGEIFWSPVQNKTLVFYGLEANGTFPATDQDPKGWALRYRVFNDPYKDKR
jgi:hypothetical protein